MVVSNHESDNTDHDGELERKNEIDFTDRHSCSEEELNGVEIVPAGFFKPDPPHRIYPTTPESEGRGVSTDGLPPGEHNYGYRQDIPETNNYQVHGGASGDLPLNKTAEGTGTNGSDKRNSSPGTHQGNAGCSRLKTERPVRITDGDTVGIGIIPTNTHDSGDNTIVETSCCWNNNKKPDPGNCEREEKLHEMQYQEGLAAFFSLDNYYRQKICVMGIVLALMGIAILVLSLRVHAYHEEALKIRSELFYQKNFSSCLLNEVRFL